VNTIAVDQVKRASRPDGATTTGAEIARHRLAVLGMPAVLHLAPGQYLGFGAAVAPIILPDGGSFFVQVAPIRRFGSEPSAVNDRGPQQVSHGRLAAWDT
jgi:hypothetical protein